VAVVVVASVALKWFLQEEDTPQALALWDRWQRTSEAVMAPPIFRSEVTNVLHRGVRRQLISYADAADVLGTLISMVVIREPSDLYDRALALARSLEQGAAYDALYLALAEAQGCDMWTADRRFVRAAQDRFGSVRWIGEAP
jgi:predicted nucleic acid-binding protein